MQEKWEYILNQTVPRYLLNQTIFDIYSTRQNPDIYSTRQNPDIYSTRQNQISTELDSNFGQLDVKPHEYLLNQTNLNCLVEQIFTYVFNEMQLWQIPGLIDPWSQPYSYRPNKGFLQEKQVKCSIIFEYFLKVLLTLHDKLVGNALLRKK